MLSDSRLLRLWESGVSCDAIDRALLLLAAARPQISVQALADVSISDRDAAIFGLRRALSGTRLACYVHCPRCSERLDFEFDSSVLPSETAVGDERELVLESGLRFRMPNSRDLAALKSAPDPETGAHLLLQRCCRNPEAVAEWSSELLDEVERVFESAKGAVDVELALTCTECSHSWAACLDVSAVIWEEIEERAERILDDVHLLASMYGWSESRILAMSPQRRQAYLSRCES